MSLFEILGENISPGPVGTINFGALKRHYRSKAIIIFKFFLAISSSIAIIYYYLPWSYGWQMTSHLKVIGGFIIYLVAGYYVHPTADTSNLGWFGGLIDNPFRYSDDINWLLMFLSGLLFPGRFLTYSHIDFIRILLIDASLIQPSEDDTKL